KPVVDIARFILDTPRVACQIRALAQRSHADLIYVNGPRLLPAVAWARQGLPVVFHSHSYLPPGLMREIAGLSLGRLDVHVIAQCEFVAALWQAFVPSGRINVIFNGVAGPPGMPLRRLGGPPKIGCVGRIAPEKGQREFVAAAARIYEALPECRFVVYGSALFGHPGSAHYSRQGRARRAAA